MCAPAMASSLHLQMQPSRLVAVLGEASLQVPCHSVAPQDSVQVNIAIRLALLGETQAQAARSAGLQVNRVSSRVDTSHAATLPIGSHCRPLTAAGAKLAVQQQSMCAGAPLDPNSVSRGQVLQENQPAGSPLGCGAAGNPRQATSSN